MFIKKNRHSNVCLKWHTGIPGRWTPDTGLWTLDAGLWTMDAELRTLDSGRWALGAGLWMLDSGRWTLDAGRWTLILRTVLILCSQSLRVSQRRNDSLIILQTKNRADSFFITGKYHTKKQNITSHLKVFLKRATH